MEDYVPIAFLNDFLFCPYSIYLHQIYGAAEEDVFKALPQKAGTAAHAERERSARPGTLWNIPVFSDELGLAGVTDELDTVTGTLTEYKRTITAVFPGQRMQLQAQYFCLLEQGRTVKAIRLSELTTGREFPIAIPGDTDKARIAALAREIKDYDPSAPVATNKNKCLKCIYCALCEKTDTDNVF